MESEQGPKIRILAYIDRFDPPEDEVVGATQWLINQSVKGFWLDVIVQLEGPHGNVVLDSLGDGKTYPTLEEAEAVVLQEIGITLQRLPEPTSPTRWSCAAYFIGEFAPTGKPEAQIIDEGGFPARNPDHSRRAE